MTWLVDLENLTLIDINNPIHKIRPGCFETNSSSVHSLSVDESGLEPSRLRVDTDGYILADFGQFGKDLNYYGSQTEKLSYLLTCCFYLNHWSTDDIENNYHFKNIEDAVRSYTGAPGIRIQNMVEPEIDHQSQPEYDLPLVNEYDKSEIINFIFNKYIRIKTTCD